MPPDSILRPASPEDAPGIAAVHVAAWRESYAGLLPHPMLDALDIAERSTRWTLILTDTGPSRTHVAVKDGLIRAFASSGPQRDADLAARGFTGEILAIYVLASAKRRGLGRALMAACARDLRASGHETAALWVLRDNGPARAFYDRLGGEVVGTRTEERPDAVLHDVACGWRTLAALTALAQ